LGKRKAPLLGRLPASRLQTDPKRRLAERNHPCDLRSRRQGEDGHRRHPEGALRSEGTAREAEAEGLTLHRKGATPPKPIASKPRCLIGVNQGTPVVEQNGGRGTHPGCPWMRECLASQQPPAGSRLHD